MLNELITFLTTNVMLANEYTKKEFWRAEEVIYQYKAPLSPDYFSFIEQGAARMEIFQEGEWVPIHLLGAESFCGIEHFVNEQLRSPFFEYRVMALTDVKVFRVQKNYFLDHMFANPQYMQLMLQQVSSFLVYMTHQHYYSKSTIEKKIANELVELTWMNLGFSPEKVNRMLVFPDYVNESYLAKLLQLDKSEITIVFKKWREEQLLLKQSPIVLDYVSLQKKSSFSEKITTQN